MGVKTGVQTSEFWVTVITTGLAFLAALGFHIAASPDMIQAIAAVAAMVASGAMAIYYQHSRTTLKKIALAIPPASPPTDAPVAQLKTQAKAAA